MSQHQRQPRQREQYEQHGQYRQTGHQGQRQPPQQMGGQQQQPRQQTQQPQMGGQGHEQMGGQQTQQPRQMGGQQQQQMGRQQSGMEMGRQERQHQPPTGHQFSQAMPQSIVTAVEDLDRLETIAEFTDQRATQQGNHEVGRIADAIKDVAHLQKEFIVEENPLAQEFGQCSQQVIQSGISQLQGHQQQPEIQELTETCQQTLGSISSCLQSMPTGGQGSGRQQW